MATIKLVKLTAMARRSHNHSGERYSRNFHQSNRVFCCWLWLSRANTWFLEEVLLVLCLQRAGVRRWGRHMPPGTNTHSVRTEAPCRCLPHLTNTCKNTAVILMHKDTLSLFLEGPQTYTVTVVHNSSWG